MSVPWVRGSWNRFAGCLFILTLGLVSAPPSSPAAEEPRRIFLIEGLTPTQPAVVQTVEAFKKRLKERTSENIEVYTDFLDLGRFRGPDVTGRMLEFLSGKFSETRPDLIVPISRSATFYIAEHRNEIAPGVPIIYCCTPFSGNDTARIPADIAGIVVEYDWAGTFKLAQRLQPNAKTVVLVSGAATFDYARREEARKQLEPYLKSYDVRYLASSQHDDLLKGVAHLPRDSIVILMPVFGVDSGRSNVPTERATDIAKASSAPTYSPVSTLFGGGIVGGNMDNYAEQGAKVADFALDVLSGKDPSTLPHETRLPMRIRVDARQLKRWGLLEASLPPGTSLEFQRPTLWQEYQDIVSLVLLAFAVQVFIIALLLIQKHERQAAEKLLKESEDRMAFAAASTNIGVWRMDVGSGQLWATEHCREMFGIAPQVPLTWDVFREAVIPDDRQAFAEWLQSVMGSGLLMAGEFRVALPGAGPRWYACQHYTVSDGDGKPVQVSGIFIDVTARKSAESHAELQHKELAHMMRVAALGELSGGIAHELSQPLAAILANAQAAQAMLAGRNYNKMELAEILEDIVQEDSRAGQVIHRLRRLLKKGDHQSSLICFNDLIMSTLGLLHSELLHRKIKVETALETGLPVISGDAVQLQQVLLNLVMNAMEAMALTPTLKRRLNICTRTTKEGCVEVSITDHGPGMASDELKRVFEPFFTTKERGLGLGLSICSMIVQSHRGRLNLANASGGGMTATVSMPIAHQLAVAS